MDRASDKEPASKKFKNAAGKSKVISSEMGAPEAQKDAEITKSSNQAGDERLKGEEAPQASKLGLKADPTTRDASKDKGEEVGSEEENAAEENGHKDEDEGKKFSKLAEKLAKYEQDLKESIDASNELRNMEAVLVLGACDAWIDENGGSGSEEAQQKIKEAMEKDRDDFFKNHPVGRRNRMFVLDHIANRLGMREIYLNRAQALARIVHAIADAGAIRVHLQAKPQGDRRRNGKHRLTYANLFNSLHDAVEKGGLDLSEEIAVINYRYNKEWPPQYAELEFYIGSHVLVRGSAVRLEPGEYSVRYTIHPEVEDRLTFELHAWE